jgi:asparagine synthase (glutamine-hydrolysing)
LQAEATFYRSVRRLLPGHVLAADDAGVRSTTYWTLDPSREDSRPVDDHCVAAVRELITDAIRIRLPEGDRLGAALTGGYDSSSIVCLMGHLDRTERGGRATIDTFSFDFGTDEADEVELIDLVARKVGARHHHVESLTPGLLDDLDTLIRANDGPVLESVMLLLWKKKRVAAAAGIDVLLSGLAGDELFMGTLDFLADLLRRGRWVELCRQVQSMYPVDRSTGKATSLRGLSRAYMVAPLLPERLRRLLKTYVGRPFPPEWIAPVLAARAGLTGRLPRSRGPRFATAFHQRAWELLGGDVMGGVLPYHDVCSAAAGVDTRFPYLDVRLVEMLFAVPREWKIDRGQVRRLQKRAMATVLPAEVQHDHLKKNFHPPLNRFMRQACRAEMDALLARPGALAREYLEWTELRGYYERYLDGRVDDPSPVWGALNLERWLEANWG